MTRVGAANGDACPQGPARALSGEAVLRLALSWARRAIGTPERARRPLIAVTVRRRMIPSAASIGAAVAIISVIALTLQHLRSERDLALSAAAREVEMRATLLAERLNAALAA